MGVVSILALCCLAGASQGTQEEPSQGADPGLLIGAWRSRGEGKTVLVFEEPGRCAWRAEGAFKACLARFETGTVTLNDHGRLISWTYAIEDEELRLLSGRLRPAKRFKRLPRVPADFEPEPMELPEPRPLPRRAVTAVVKELRKRAREDQRVRSGPAQHAEMKAVDRRNAAWLRKTLAKTGWIDAQRFGVNAADDAWILAVHSEDLPLMLAALEGIRTDVRRHRLPDGENYANLYDRLQMRLGRRQRYGTQIIQDAEGRFLLFPMEDREKVDRHRAELRMEPLAESLEMHRKWTGGKKIGVQEF